RSRREGAFELLSPSFGLDIVPGPTVEASREAYELAGIGPEDVDLAQLQDTDAGSEVIHMAENGLCAAGGAGEVLAAGGPPSLPAGSRTPPTAGSAPAASRSGRRACARSMSW